MNGDDSPIHGFFGLSYANYLVLPRTLLQSCTIETQQAVVDALELVYAEEEKNLGEHWPCESEIIVKLRDSKAKRFIRDDWADYERGRRMLWPA